MAKSHVLVGASATLALLLTAFVPTTTAPPGRFEIEGDGESAIVRDTKTGLVWRRGFVTDLHWDAAQSYCAGLGSDFRLPSLGEIETLLGEHLSTDFALFPATPGADDSTCFWTSSPHARSLGQVYCVNFAYGGTKLRAALTDTAYTRCVR